MEEKYITKLLNFSSDIMCNAKELIITKEQAKGIIKELEQDYIPKALIKLEIEKFKKIIEEKRIENITIGNATKYDYLIIGKRDGLQEILNRSDIKEKTI
ncbi:MAG: hypothetical protein HFJ50_02035 [Clostridia bacterium]|jgi:hypothetical protein|nr:hypothetical protein [Clostridia bacterium]